MRKPLLVLLGTVLLYILVRVEPFFQFDHPHLEALTQQQRNSFGSGFGAGGIGVEIHINRIAMAFNGAGLRLFKRRPTTGDYFVDTTTSEDADHVHVPFH